MRSLALALLNDDTGISIQAWYELKEKLGPENDDIARAVRFCEGRAFIPLCNLQMLKKRINGSVETEKLGG